ncbi:ABC transporter ATP-binding protein [Collinsella tanakaei]|nr:ABC transporter ATP-binding protein [Collinsella tanakaei]
MSAHARRLVVGRGEAPLPGAGLAVEAHGLVKQFGNRRGLDGVDLEVPAGAFLSVFGPNGAGKTTLLRMLALLSRPTRGSLRLLGVDALEDADALRSRVGLISHTSMLYGDLTARENLEFFSSLYGAPDRARIDELLRLVELDHRRNDCVRTFSRGMQQRLSIARALINDPELVLLDEPYSGLDPHAAELFDGLIARVRAGRTFIMVSHDLDRGFELCSHALILARGRVVVCAEKEQVDAAAFKDLYRATVGMGVA